MTKVSKPVVITAISLLLAVALAIGVYMFVNREQVVIGIGLENSEIADEANNIDSRVETDKDNPAILINDMKLLIFASDVCTTAYDKILSAPADDADEQNAYVEQYVSCYETLNKAISSNLWEKKDQKLVDDYLAVSTKWVATLKEYPVRGEGEALKDYIATHEPVTRLDAILTKMLA